MKATVVLFTLLCCCVSGAQVQKRDVGDEGSGKITEQMHREGRSRVNVTPASNDIQQTCQPDIHTVLREMTAMMTEQKLEITNWKKESKAQTDALASMTEKSNSIQSEVEALRRVNEEQAVKLSMLEEQKSLVNMLKNNQEVSKVAFSASLLASGSGTSGPYNAEVILIYKHIFTNIGSAYNSNTGFFTAPVRGVYQFQIYVGAHGHASNPSAAALFKNGQKEFIAYSQHTTSYGNASNGVSLLLEVGDVVYVRLWENSRLFDSENHHSTFSGHLLFTM